MNKKFLHDFESYRESNKKAVKEGMSIYEFEDETQESTDDVVDLDAETPASNEEAPEEVTTEEAPEEVAVEAEVEAAPAVEEEAIDFGDGGTIPQETAMSELEFVVGIISQFQKLAKKEVKLDDSMKAKIRKAFEIFK
jgi:hypothetical protein